MDKVEQDKQQHFFVSEGQQTEDITEEVQEKTFKVFKYRWVILFTYVFANLAVSAMWITVAPISTQIEQVYQVSSLLVNGVTLAFPIIYTVLNFPSIYVLDDLGLKTGIIIGTVTTIIGLWIRIFINHSFYWVIVGQLFGGIGQPFLLNCPAKIATFWFSKEQRPVITGILSLLNPLGVGIGFVMPAIMISDTSNEHEMFELMLVQAILFTLFSLPALFLFKNKPRIAPSLGAETDKVLFKQSIKVLFKDANFIVLLVSFTLIQGNFNTIATLVGSFVQAYGFTATQGGVFGGTCVVFGLIGGIIGSILTMQTLKYKLVMVVYGIFAFITYIALFGTLYVKSFWLTFVVTSLFGFFNIAMIPLCIDFACEITFPIGEAMTSGCLLTLGQLLSVIQVVIISVAWPTDDKGFMNEKEVLYASTIGAGMLFISVILNALLKQNLKRVEEERKHISLQQQVYEEEIYNGIE